MPSTVGIVAGSRDEFTPLDVSPYRWYDFGDVSSMQISSSSGVYIGPDGLKLTPATGSLNAAEVQTSVTLISDFDVVCKLALTNWAAADQMIISVGSQAYMQHNWALRVESNALVLEGNQIGTVSRPIPSWTNGTSHWVRIRRNESTGVITFYSSEDGVAWSQLGTTHSGFVGALNSLYWGATWIGKAFGYLSSANGTVQRVQIWSGGLDTGGTKLVDVDFTAPSALYRTFTYDTVRGARINLSSTTVGAAISQVNDKSGNLRHLTQATVTAMPVLRNVDDMPRTSLYFNDAHRLVNAANVTSPCQIFIVARRQKSTVGYLMDASVDGNRLYLYWTGGLWDYLNGQFNYDDLNQRTLFQIDWTTPNIVKMGTTTTFTGGTVSMTPQGISIGGRFGGTEFWQGHVCEAIYTPPLSVAQANKLREYLRSKWAAVG